MKASRAGIVTVSLRREQARGNTGERFFELIQELGVRVLPNTAGCRTPKEAITTAQMARELFDTDWIKLEVIANDDTLQPDLFGLVEAAAALTKDGFKVFPYTTEDLGAAERLLAAGCEVLMPWGAPIGTGRGLANPYALQVPAQLFPRRAAGHRCRHRRALACRRRPWRWATTRCCSTRRLPRPPIRCAWRAPSPPPSRPAAPPTRPA